MPDRRTGRLLDRIHDNTLKQRHIANSAIGQGELKSTTASSSVLVASDSAGSITLSGATYSWWTGSADNRTVDSGVHFGNGNTAAGTIGLFNDDTSDRLFYIDERYIQASPPYHGGPLFVELAIDKSMNIVHAKVSPDPVYAYHGPTDITPQYYRNGRAFRKVKMINGIPFNNAILTMDLSSLILEDIYEEEVEITLDYKDSDKDIVPHYFVNSELSGLTVVRLEPDTRLMRFMYEMCQAGASHEALHDIVLAGRLKIDNTELDVPNMPKDLMCVRASLK